MRTFLLRSKNTLELLAKYLRADGFETNTDFREGHRDGQWLTFEVTDEAWESLKAEHPALMKAFSNGGRIKEHV